MKVEYTKSGDIKPIRGGEPRSMTYDKVGDNKQECFVFVGNSPHAIKQHLDKQIKDGYTIANISHAVTKHGYEDVYNCIVIANK